MQAETIHGRLFSRLAMPDRKQRHGLELLNELVFRPAAHVVVLVLRPLRVPPPAVVVAGACAGLAAAFEIRRGAFVAAAILLQAKTLLDNADGQLARLTGRTSAFGRYLDSESDLVVNAAVFAALATRIGPAPAILGFVLLTGVLSANFNVERLYAGTHGASPPASDEIANRRTQVAARLYRILYAPHDRIFEALARRRPDAWNEPLGVQLLANFGLSTQLAALGLCLALGRPSAYVFALLGCGALCAAVLLRRELLVRRLRFVIE